MTAIILASAYLIALTLNVATARGGPVRMTERGSAVLVWLERHPKPGTAHSRAVVRNRFRLLVWRGLRIAGVAWLDRRTGDVDPASPFGCLHGHEGSWDDPDDPHWGGLQMDRGFMGTYGSDYISAFNGYANVWPIWAQVVAGYRAFHGHDGYRARGYSPWSTRGMCGL